MNFQVTFFYLTFVSYFPEQCLAYRVGTQKRFLFNKLTDILFIHHSINMMKTPISITYKFSFKVNFYSIQWLSAFSISRLRQLAGNSGAYGLMFQRNSLWPFLSGFLLSIQHFPICASITQLFQDFNKVSYFFLKCFFLKENNKQKSS